MIEMESKYGQGKLKDIPQILIQAIMGILYLTGSFYNTVNFGSSTLTSRGWRDIFIAKFDTAGNAVWAKQGGGKGSDDYSYGITTDSNGNVFATGYFQDTAFFETDTLIADIDPFGDAREIFIAKYNPAGSLLWAKQSKESFMGVGKQR